MLIPFIITATGRGAAPPPAPAPAPTADRGQDAGSGRRIEPRFIDPREVYGEPKPVPAVTARQKAQLEARARAAEARVEALRQAGVAAELTGVSCETSELSRAVARLDLAMETATAYELLVAKASGLERELGEVEAAIAHRLWLLREDEELLTILRLSL